MRWQTGSSLALLASSPVVQASRPRLYRRQDQSSGYNGTMLPQQLASSSGVDTTPVTLTYAFVPETHRSQASTLPTVSVISTYIVISTFSPSSAVHTDVDSVSTSPAAPLIASPNATNRPYPVSGSAGYVVPGNGTFSSASARQTNARSSPRPEAHNDTCGGATLNVLSAHLDYWYTETYTHTVSTVSLQFSPNETQTGWTLLPEASTFDITTAIASPTCTSSEGLNRAYNFTETYWDCFTTPPPVASSTTLITVDAFKSLNQTTGNGTNFPNLATEPPAAVATLPSAAGTFTEGTPFVYFSEFEIESSRPTTFPNGSEACATATQKFLLNRLFSFEYSDDDGELSQQQLAKEDTSGLLDPEFLRLAGITGSITPGTWTAEPTVIVVVEREVVAQAVLGAYRSGAPAGIEGPLMTPTPTLPSFLSSIKPTTATSPRTFYSPYIEQTAAALDVPTPEATTSFKPFFLFSRLRTFIAHIEHSETTLVLPQETDADVITTKIGNTPVTATAAPTQGSDAEPVMSTLQGDGEGLGDSSGQDEDEGNWIVRPFFAHVEESDVVLDIPAPETAKVVTAAFQGKTVTATAVKAAATGAGGSGSGGGKNNGGGSNGGSSNGGSSNNGGGSNGGSHTGGSSNNGGESNNGGGSGGNGGNMGNSDNNGNNGNGGGFAHIVSAIANAAKPSNAAQAMNQAGNQGHNDATAAAIAAGLGIAAGAGASENGGASGGVSNGGSGSGSESGSGSGFAAGSGSGSHGGSAGGSNNQPERLGASPGQIITVDNAAVTGQAAPAFVVGGQTVVPGGAPITVDGHVISAPASTNAIVVDGSTARFGGVVDSSTAFNVNGMAITAAPNVAFPIAGQTLQAGGPAITVDGTRLSLAPGGTALVIGSSTSRIAAAGAGVATDIPELTVGSQTFTANAATQFLLAPGQTLTPGGTAVVSGTTVSLAADGSNIVINGHTQTFASSPDATITPRAGIITVDGHSFAPNAGGTYLISGQTLTPGGSITVTGANGVETLSLSPQGSQLVAVVSGHTITSSLNGAAAAEATAAPVLTIGGKTFTALPGSDGTNPTYLIDGKVLTAGEEETVTVGGKTYVVSLAPEATLLEVEELGANGKPTKTSLQTLFPATATGKTSTMTGTRSSEGSGSESGSGTETGATAAPPAKETGAASGKGAQFASIFAVAGTLAFALLS